jgi:hypothetical protein
MSLSTGGARNLATTTKSVPQMQGISSRWLLRLLPWVSVGGGVFRVNRRVVYAPGSGRVSFASDGDSLRVVPPSLAELPLLRGFSDESVLSALADRFVPRRFDPGDVLVETGADADAVFLVAHGKVNRIGTGKYGDQTVLGVVADGEHLGDQVLGQSEGSWGFTGRAVTPVTALVLSRADFEEVVGRSDTLRAHVAELLARAAVPQNAHGEASIDVASGHSGEPELPGTFVDYELSPREYELSVAQTVLRVHSRVADLYNEPMNQVEEQVRLTVEALRERQESELLNNSDFGLLHNVELGQRVHTRSGPPTPDDLDDLLATVWKEPSFFLAHPKAIAAFGREVTHRGLYPQSIELTGNKVPAWRGVPIFPSNKIPVSDRGSTSILLLRTGEQNGGVVGLQPAALPDEYQPGVSVRFMGINDRAIISYLISAYYSVAPLVSDAVGLLENVELGRHHDED